MKPKVLPTTILLSILFIVFFVIYMKFYDEEKKSVQTEILKYETVCGQYNKGEIQIGSKILSVDISDNECKRNLGLSGKTSSNEEGMMFIFDKVGNYGFWMKDMNFPIDILWINEAFKIVGIEKIVFPETYPKTIGKKYTAKYVLEVTSGYSDINNIKIGDSIIFTEK